jgi:hypothetical protein
LKSPFTKLLSDSWIAEGVPSIYAHGFVSFLAKDFSIGSKTAGIRL